jgi:hypothetical protein
MTTLYARFMITLALAIAIVFMLGILYARAQGIYMGRDGRVHAQVIVGTDGGIFPVVPTPCYSGPCPVILAPPLPWRHPKFVPPPPLPQK